MMMDAHDEEITAQVGVNVLGAPDQVILLDATDCVADGSLDFFLGFQGKRP